MGATAETTCFPEAMAPLAKDIPVAVRRMRSRRGGDAGPSLSVSADSPPDSASVKMLCELAIERAGRACMGAVSAGMGVGCAPVSAGVAGVAGVEPD